MGLAFPSQVDFKRFARTGITQKKVYIQYIYILYIYPARKWSKLVASGWSMVDHSESSQISSCCFRPLPGLSRCPGGVLRWLRRAASRMKTSMSTSCLEGCEDLGSHLTWTLCLSLSLSAGGPESWNSHQEQLCIGFLNQRTVKKKRNLRMHPSPTRTCLLCVR